MEEKFNLIWERYSKNICYYITRLIPRNHPDFDDIFQEIMEKIYMNLQHLETTPSPVPWLYRITRNHCIDYMRKNSAGATDSESELIDRENSPEEAYVQNESARKIIDALGKLESRDREICYLHFFEDLKYREITGIMELKVNTIKTRMRFIKRFLKQELGELP